MSTSPSCTKMSFTHPPASTRPITPKLIAVSVIAVCAFWRRTLRSAREIMAMPGSAAVTQRVHDLLARRGPGRVHATDERRGDREEQRLERNLPGHDDLAGQAVRHAR